MSMPTVGSTQSQRAVAIASAVGTSVGVIAVTIVALWVTGMFDPFGSIIEPVFNDLLDAFARLMAGQPSSEPRLIPALATVPEPYRPGYVVDYAGPGIGMPMDY